MISSLTGFLKGLLLQDPADRSKQLSIQISSGATTGTTTNLVASQTADRTITLPDSSGELLTDSSSGTISNKIIDNTNTITVKDDNFTIQNDADITKQVQFNAAPLTTGTTVIVDLPDTSGALLTSNSTATLSNKTLDNTTIETIKDANFTIQDDADVTKQAQFELSGLTTGNTRTYSLPDATTSIVGTTPTQTLSNKTLDNTTSLTIQDSNLTVQDNVDNTKQVQLQLSGLTTSTTRTLTVPDATTTIVGTDVTQTLSNKTFSDAITQTQIATPSNPPSSNNKLYFKSTDQLYMLNSAGLESQLSGALTNPMTTLGDMITGGSSGLPTRLVGDTSNTRKFVRELSVAGVATAPAWDTLIATDIPPETVTTITTTTSVTTSTSLLLCSSANLTVNLYTAVGNSGRTLKIIKTDSSLTNAIIINPSGSETIDGSLTKTLRTQYESLVIQSNGSNWFVVARHKDSNPTPYTPVFTNFGAVTTHNVQSMRRGNNLEVYGTFTAPTPAGAPGSVSLQFANQSVTIDSTVVQATPNTVFGNWGAFNTVNSSGPVISSYGTSVTDIYFSTNNSAVVNANVMGGAGNIIAFHATVPILGWDS